MLSPGVRPFYFVTFNTCRRAALLARDTVHQTFLRFCKQALARGVTVGRYVLMPDHAHLFVALPPGEATLARWVQALKNFLGKALLRLGDDKPHWQEGFFDHVLRSDESYAQKWEYVRQNPVRAGLAASPEEWPYQGEVAEIRF
jgi:REP element-mobilizing transposase RayT